MKMLIPMITIAALTLTGCDECCQKPCPKPACKAAACNEYGWEMGEPIITYWAGPGYPGHPLKITDATAAEFKEAGFNTVWVSSKAELDICQKYGLRGLAHFGLPRSAALTEAGKKSIAKKVNEVKDHPALYFYHHTDEPSAAWFGYLVDAKAFMKSLDPKHPTWVNLLPTYANNKQLGVDGEIFNAYKVHVDAFLDEYKPAFLSYDHYQMNNFGDTTNYFYNLELVRERCEKRGVPLMNGVQTCTWRPGSAASPSAPRIPNADELRYLVYTTAAFGCQGIYYYVYSYRGHVGSIVSFEDGKKSDKYEELKTLNPAFGAIAKQLRKMKFKGAFGCNYAAKGLKPYGDDAILKLDAKGPVLVTRFDACCGAKAFVVVNLDYKKETEFKVSAPKALEAFDAAKGTWSAFDGNLKLRKGAGILLRMK